MAEPMVSIILEQLTTTAIENAKVKWKLVRGVDREIERLESNFRAIKYVLEDAEQKEYQNKLVRHWLERFRAVSYEMEDVLDEWNTAIRKLQPPKKLCSFVSLPCLSFGSQVVRRHDIASRIKEINQELELIAKDKGNIELINRGVKPFKRPESTSFMDVTTVLGRDQIREDIVRLLLSGSSEEEVGCCFQTISIVGIGGIGKTALAQLIFNDNRVKTHFQRNTIWVCVSESFDQMQVAKAILGGLPPDSSSTNPQNLDSLEAVLKEISERIRGNKFFLVLDDVWPDQDQDWEALKASLQKGNSGSWILVTTRKESVTRQMVGGTWKSNLPKFHVFPLDLLPTDICWSILAQKAFAGRNRDSCEKFEDIGREIANKCKGLPLAAKTLGSLLQNKLRIDEWQRVLNSEIWQLGLEEQIFKPLLLSYYDLPSTIRPCLLYCTIFPKDYRIEKTELIWYWMAQGYLNSGDSFECELRGEDYFKCLASYCFFQDFEKDEDGNITECKMHDMVHDFVQFMERSECVAKEIHSGENMTLGSSSNKTRHLRLEIARRCQFLTYNAGMENLRSLLISHRHHIACEVWRNVFNQSKRLRLLRIDSSSSLSPHYPDLKIPREIAKLIHLRYLRLTYCSIRTLPEAVCELWNLQGLDLFHCRNLVRLPHGIRRLINLRCLLIQHCPRVHFPKGIGRLTHLTKLACGVRIDGDDSDEFSVGDLQNLNQLRGNLYLCLRGDAIAKGEFERAKLHNKIHLKHIFVTDHCMKIPREAIVDAFNVASNIEVNFHLMDLEIEKNREKIEVAEIVQRAFFQFIDAAS